MKYLYTFLFIFTAYPCEGLKTPPKWIEKKNQHSVVVFTFFFILLKRDLVFIWMLTIRLQVTSAKSCPTSAHYL